MTINKSTPPGAPGSSSSISNDADNVVRMPDSTRARAGFGAELEPSPTRETEAAGGVEGAAVHVAGEIRAGSIENDEDLVNHVVEVMIRSSAPPHVGEQELAEKVKAAQFVLGGDPRFARATQAMVEQALAEG